MTAPPDLTDSDALFLDFDGTLVEFAPTPDGVDVPDDLLPLLTALKAKLGGALAFVTGRAIDNLDALLGTSEHIAAGVHGAEWRLADGDIETAPGDPFAAEQAEVQRYADGREGVVMQPKSGGFTLHYRLAPDLRGEAEAVMRQAFASRHDFDLLDGAMMWEARRVGIDKGTGIELLAKHEPFAGRRPVFIGDDVTDEDGFRAVLELGGVAIKVGEGGTVAGHRLPDIPAVYDWLRRAAEAT